MARPEVQEAFVAMVKEATRSGSRGPQRDMALMASPWGFRPQDIGIPVNLQRSRIFRPAYAPPESFTVFNLSPPKVILYPSTRFWRPTGGLT